MESKKLRYPLTPQVQKWLRPALHGWERAKKLGERLRTLLMDEQLLDGTTEQTSFYDVIFHFKAAVDHFVLSVVRAPYASFDPVGFETSIRALVGAVKKFDVVGRPLNMRLQLLLQKAEDEVKRLPSDPLVCEDSTVLCIAMDWPLFWSEKRGTAMSTAITHGNGGFDNPFLHFRLSRRMLAVYAMKLLVFEGRDGSYGNPSNYDDRMAKLYTSYKQGFDEKMTSSSSTIQCPLVFDFRYDGDPEKVAMVEKILNRLGTFGLWNDPATKRVPMAGETVRSHQEHCIHCQQMAIHSQMTLALALASIPAFSRSKISPLGDPQAMRNILDAIGKANGDEIDGRLLLDQRFTPAALKPAIELAQDLAARREDDNEGDGEDTGRDRQLQIAAALATRRHPRKPSGLGFSTPDY